ncbi:MAG: hypothetical protein GWN71_33305, partial [Gammaproteobacteria bacterium]|nr:hypothetical protein [Gemmatimonadota bacterium]NIU78259.1 hypothetical protein [Gammaproteobacteria bacterium]
GASAAVPGSPVRAWLGSALAPDEQQAETVRAPDTSSGVSIAPVDGRIVIEVLDATPGTMLRVRPVTDAKASVVVPE